MYQDTIAAISTPLGEGGIGIVRLSGSEARSIARTLFRGQLADRRLSYGHIIDPATDEAVDEVLVSYMAAPHTYTREDVVEINCHGGPAPLQQILQLTLRHGAQAGPSRRVHAEGLPQRQDRPGSGRVGSGHRPRQDRGQPATGRPGTSGTPVRARQGHPGKAAVSPGPSYGQNRLPGG